MGLLFYLEDQQRLLIARLNCTCADSDGHYTLLSYEFGMFSSQQF